MPEVLAVEQEGIEDASICPLVLEALDGNGEVLIGPSNPIKSIGPIVFLPGMPNILRKRFSPFLRTCKLKICYFQFKQLLKKHQ